MSSDPSTPAPNPHNLIQHLRAGQLAQAEQLAADLTVRDPHDPLGWKVLGSLLLQRGCGDEAFSALERARELSPNDAETLNNLAYAHYTRERLDEALALCRLALEQRPEFAECLHNQGMILHAANRLNEALDSYDRALALRPDYVKAHNNRGNVLRDLERYPEALASYDQALTRDPYNAEAYSYRGLVLLELGRFNEALDSQTRALAIRNNHPAIWASLGLVLRAKGRFPEALTAFDQALHLDPGCVEALNNRGLVLQAIGHAEAALECFEQALSIKPNCVEVLNNLGILHCEQRQYDAALETLNAALAIDPNNVQVLINRSRVLQDFGQLETALADLERAQILKPSSVMAFRNTLFLLNYHPDKSGQEIAEAYREFDRRFGQPQRASWRAHANDRAPERRLRLGYVSPDFRTHSASHFLEPLLACHDRERFEVSAYAELTQEDALTERYRRLVDRWIPTSGLSDAELAERIRADGIDILIDLAGHTANNRLGVFARRPAPVSVSWLGYGYTTGLTAIDYFLTDAVMVPPGSESLFAEQVWRIEAPSLVYRPADDMGEVAPLPAPQDGQVTFGTLTRSVRINHRVIGVWSRILQRLPQARLVIDSKDFATEAMQQRLAERFAAHGIASERVQIGYHSPPWDVLRGLDIALDCFPHNSGTTLIESLYLGVPFVTLAARPSVGRIGSLILTAAGHPEWIATTEDDYVDKAVALAGDLERLARLRVTLRAQLEAGPWRDEAGFAQRVEHAYRHMWLRWCETAPAP